MKLFFRSMLVLVLCFGLILSGCAAKPANEPSSQIDSQSQSSSQAVNEPAATKTITDMAGRTVEIPGTIDKAYCSNPVSSLMVYTFAPEKLLGWNYKFNEAESKYILPEYQKLPVFGMGDSVNLEAVISAKPQVCFVAGNIEKSDIENAEKLGSQLGVPVIMIDGALTKTAEAYTLLGEVFGMTDRAKTLSDYAKNILDTVANTKIPVSEKVTVYYGNGIDSLDTSPKGSTAAQTVEMLGAVNVTEVESKKGARIKVSMEQILKWNPQYIFVNGEAKDDITGTSAAKEILSNPKFSTINAVKNKKVFGIPKQPFSWLDRPVSANRLLGLKWAGNILYPKYYSFDIKKEIKDFYDLFYHMQISDSQIEELLNS